MSEPTRHIQLNTQKEISPLQAAINYFVYYINHTNYKVFFNKQFSKDFQKFSTYYPKVVQTFPIAFKIFLRLPKISKDYPKMFRLWTNTF